jgi:hypothetical protein
MPKILDCDRCLLYACDPHLVCAVHPAGIETDSCPDFDPDPNLEPEELWQPVGASYYNGELVLQPRQLSDEERLEMLDWHPLFTGRCPNCEMPISPEPVRRYYDCSKCGWLDNSA